jgi:hypothetical protein
MSDLTFGVRDDRAVIRNVYAADRIAVEAMRATTRRSGNRAYKAAQRYCPVDTRFMKEHMRLEFSDDDLIWELGWNEFEFEAAGLPFYPPYQEYGTDRHPAQPSVTPAHFEEEPRYQRELGRDIEAALERMRAA